MNLDDFLDWWNTASCTHSGERGQSRECSRCVFELVEGTAKAIRAAVEQERAGSITVSHEEWQYIGCVLALARQVCESAEEGGGRIAKQLREAGKTLDTMRARKEKP